MTATAHGIADSAIAEDEVTEFLYREARHADENDYDAWESLWTDDATYWVPADDPDNDPDTCVSVIYDNRRRISTRLKQLRTGKRYAQSPRSSMRRIVSNIEHLGQHENGDTIVGANFMLLESRARGIELWGGRTTYRIRRVENELKLSYKKVVLVNLDTALPTLGFLI